MKLKSILMTVLLALVAGGVNAQTSVTVGSQVTDVANIVSGKAYLLRWDGLTGTPYALDTGGSNYGMANNNTATQAAVYYLISDGNGGYKIENAYTGKYWPTPSSNGQAMAPTTAASAGTWTIAASGTANRFTFTCGSYHTNRSSSQLVAHTTDSPVSIYEVAGTLATSSTYSILSGKDIEVSSTAASSISEGQWYVMSQRSRTSYVFENTSDHKLKHTQTKPSGSATEKAGYLMRVLSADGSKYYLQNGFGNYMGAIAASTNVPTTALGEEALTVAKIASTDGHFYLQGTTNGVVLDGNDFSGGDPSTVVGWGTSAPTSTGGNNDWAFYPVELVDSWVPTAAEVYTIANTANRGNLTYDPTANGYYVWSSGKSGATAFDATSANCQWVVYPTGTSGQYYLFNVGAGKFAVPSGMASGSGNAWYFSKSAVAVVIEAATGGYKIKAASDPVSGTNAAYMSVSNNYTGPIINYDDAGSIFAFTKVTGDQSTAAAAAVNKLVKNASTALTSYPQTSGWYVIQIKSANSATGTVGRYVYENSTLTSGLYPLTFTGNVDLQPSISDPTFFTHLECTSWDNNEWQLPDGRFLVGDGNNKFPVISNTASSIIAGYDGGNYFKSSSNRFADPYTSNGYFVGETTSFRTTWNVFPINLTTAGLVDWKVLITSDGTTPVYDKEISCTRSDVAGLTSVYTGGHFFLPTGVTPTDADFSLAGATSFTIDGTNHTITANFDPNLAILANDVTVAQGWQTAGRSSDVYLLRVTANPFQDATGASLTVSLKDGTENQISSLTLYEANSSSPEVLGTGSGVPTLTQLATTTIDGSSTTATFTIGSLTAGTHYYWLRAAVKSTATLGAVLDAAVTSLTYTCNNHETTLDLTSVGDPADRGAMVFNVRSYPFLPRDNGSRVYRIPAMIVADDGSIVVAADKRYDSHTDIGGGHVIDIVIRRSTDGGKTWSEPVTIAKGLGTADDDKCGYGDPSLVKGKDGKLYCLFVAGNLGYFYGQKRIAMTTSSDNGVTWSSSESTPPIDLLESGRLQNYNTVGEAGYGLYDYFVTSGRGLYIPEDDILMYLIPAQTMTSATEHTSNSQDYLFYSTDGGTKWYFSPQIMFQGGDEAKIIQMNDGSLLGSVRQAYNRGFNTATYTKNNDGTLSFTMGTQWNNSQLYAGGYANNQDIFYYQRETVTGKTDVIFHSMTTGQHANLKLYYSTDGGTNWTEFLNVQTKGARYVTMERSGSEANPGSLYLFYEDQSLNSAGGYTDYNHYPLNFLEITRDQLEALIPTLNDEIQVNPAEGVKVVYGTTGHTTYGTLNGLTWTSKVTSNVATGDNTIAGLTMVASDGAFDQFSSWNSHYNLAYHPATANTDATLTLTAPAGYAISSYSMLVAKGSSASHTYTVTNEAGTSVDVPFGSNASSYATVSQSDINAASTVITVNTSDVNKWLAIADFVVNLKKAVTYQLVDESGTLGASQLVVFETNSVEDEMPDALKTSGYTYTFFSDAACTISVTEIGNLTTIYVLKKLDPIENGLKVTIQDPNNAYVAATGSHTVKASAYLHPDCAWTFEKRTGEDTYNIKANDGTYLVPQASYTADAAITTQTSEPAVGWTLTASNSTYTITSGTTTYLSMPANATTGTGVVNNSSSATQFIIETAPSMFNVSTDDAEYWYNLGVSRSGSDSYAVDLGKVGRAVYGNSTIQNDNMAQQWKFTRCPNGGFYLVNRQDRSYLNPSVTREGSGTSAGVATTDAEPANALFPNYQSSNGSYNLCLSDGSHKLSVGDNNLKHRIIKGTSTGTPYEFTFTTAPTPAPLNYLETGWYRIKYHKNAELTGSDACTENQHAGKYLFNSETWAYNNGSGTYPVLHVQETATQPNDDDATYYVYVEKDGSNVMLRGANGHYLSTWGYAGYTTSDGELTNILKASDGDGYCFGDKAGHYMVVTAGHATAGDNNLFMFIPTSSDQLANRVLLRPIDLDAVGLDAYDAVFSYSTLGSNYLISPDFETNEQHDDPYMTTVNANVKGITTFYHRAAVFVPTGTTLVASDFTPATQGSKAGMWQEFGDWFLLPTITINNGNKKIFLRYESEDYIVRNILEPCQYVDYPGYPKSTCQAFQAVNALTGLSTPHDYVSGMTHEQVAAHNFTAEKLETFEQAVTALYEETDIVLPADGTAFMFIGQFYNSNYDTTNPFILMTSKVDSDNDPEDATSQLELHNFLHWYMGGEGRDNMFTPLGAYFIGKTLDANENKMAFVNLTGDYICYTNAAGNGAYGSKGAGYPYTSNTYLKVKKLRVEDLPANTNTIGRTNKDFYGCVYLKGYRSEGVEGVLTFKEDAYDENTGIIPLDNSNAPYFDGTYTSAFKFGYDYSGRMNSPYLNEDVAVHESHDSNNPGFYTTLYLPFPVEIPSGATAYVATSNYKGTGENADKDYLTMTALTGTLPAKTAAIIKFDSNPTDGKYTFVPSVDMTTADANAALATDNYFHGRLIDHNPQDITITSTDYPWIYTFAEELNKDNQYEVGFYRFTGVTLKAGKIYMTGDDIKAVNTGNAKGFILDFGNQATGLNSVESRVEGVESVYDLSGRKVNNGSKWPKGIYIMNGKKAVIK